MYVYGKKHEMREVVNLRPGVWLFLFVCVGVCVLLLLLLLLLLLCCVCVRLPRCVRVFVLLLLLLLCAVCLQLCYGGCCCWCCLFVVVIVVLSHSLSQSAEWVSSSVPENYNSTSSITHLEAPHHVAI